MSFLLKIENIAKSSKILISAKADFLHSKDRGLTIKKFLPEKYYFNIQTKINGSFRLWVRYRRGWEAAVLSRNKQPTTSTDKYLEY